MLTKYKRRKNKQIKKQARSHQITRAIMNPPCLRGDHDDCAHVYQDGLFVCVCPCHMTTHMLDGKQAAAHDY